MKFWYELVDVKYVTINYGRYEAVQVMIGPRPFGCINDILWIPVLAGPQPA